ncbi:MAG: hypothetical protein K6C08_11210 [Oscillospiraceae bacterium]|nr:hypothetical protein [Oscillospiraceae bacterium]
MKKSDFINPIKEFVEEVHNDTVGDAWKFYSNVAKNAEKNAHDLQEKAKAKQAAIRREQEEMKKRRSETMRRASILFIVIIFTAIFVVSLALHFRVG